MYILTHIIQSIIENNYELYECLHNDLLTENVTNFSKVCDILFQKQWCAPLIT